jgi:hypothetical protein
MCDVGAGALNCVLRAPLLLSEALSLVFAFVLYRSMIALSCAIQARRKYAHYLSRSFISSEKRPEHLEVQLCRPII